MQRPARRRYDYPSDLRLQCRDFVLKLDRLEEVRSALDQGADHVALIRRQLASPRLLIAGRRLVDRGPKRQRGDRANTRDGHQTTAKQAENLAIIVTHDENGGFWDPMAPPRGDRWGPGSRIPTVIASPYAKKGFVDHTVYDTTSILQFILKRFELHLSAKIHEARKLLGWSRDRLAPKAS